MILVLLASHALADDYKDISISANMIYGALAVIIGTVVTITIIVIAALGMLPVLGIHLSNWTDWSALQAFNWASFTSWSALVPYAITIVAVLISLIVLVVVAAIFLRRSLNTVYEKPGIHMFATTGLLILIGAILTIIVVGLLLLWISLILIAVAFSQMKP